MNQNHDNDIDPIPSIDENTVICNEEENVPIIISHIVSEKIHLKDKNYENRRKDDNIVTYNIENNMPM